MFAAAVLPLVHYCNPASADTISTNMKLGLYDADTFPDFASVKGALEEAYPCLGITCAQVGELTSAGAGGTVDASKVAACTLAPIAGYIPGSDVTEHNKVDLDQKAMETALKSADFSTAQDVYENGQNSQGSSGLRTLQGFSTGAESKMYDGCPGCPYKHYSMFYEYYGDFAYSDKWVSAALAGNDMGFTSGRHSPNALARARCTSAARARAAKTLQKLRATLTSSRRSCDAAATSSSSGTVASCTEAAISSVLGRGSLLLGHRSHVFRPRKRAASSCGHANALQLGFCFVNKTDTLSYGEYRPGFLGLRMGLVELFPPFFARKFELKKNGFFRAWNMVF